MNTDLVAVAIYYYEQSTPEKFEEDPWKANDFESRIYRLFKIMTDAELDEYRRRLVSLGYVDASEYSRSENGLVTEKTFKNKQYEDTYQ
jgi:hypothetical protein